MIKTHQTRARVSQNQYSRVRSRNYANSGLLSSADTSHSAQKVKTVFSCSSWETNYDVLQHDFNFLSPATRPSVSCAFDCCGARSKKQRWRYPREQKEISFVWENENRCLYLAPRFNLKAFSTSKVKVEVFGLAFDFTIDSRETTQSKRTFPRNLLLRRSMEDDLREMQWSTAKMATDDPGGLGMLRQSWASCENCNHSPVN